jgi:ankyrin repeat protein
MEFWHFSTLDTFNLQQPLILQAATYPQHQKPQTSSLPDRTLMNHPSKGTFSSVTINDKTRSKSGLVKKMLKSNRFLVYGFDETKQTPLHWAAQRGKYDVLMHIIERKSHINAKEVIGRTPCSMRPA